MQQKVFKFIKANIDASGIMALLRITYDAKAKAGKSQTMYNMFYKSFTPHIVAQKAAIYELAEDKLVQPVTFIGAPGSHSDILNNGILGTLAVKSASTSTVTVDATVLDNLIAKANSMLTPSDTPFTINDCFVSIFGAKSGLSGGYQLVFPTKVAPALAGGTYTFTISTLTGSIAKTAAAYFILTLAKSSSDGMDAAKRKFSADSVELAHPQDGGGGNPDEV